MVGDLFTYNLLILLFSLFLLVPLVLTLCNIWNLFSSKKLLQRSMGTVTLIIGPIFSLILYSIWDTEEWQSSLFSRDDLNFHAPISLEYAYSFIILLILAIIACIILLYCKFILPPLVSVLCISFLYIGCGLSFVWILQLLPHINEAYVFFPIECYYMILFPINFFILSITILTAFFRKTAEKDYKQSSYQILTFCHKILSKTSSLPILALLPVLPILGIFSVILILFGQQPDALIKSFTQTSDWLLSQQVSPPAVYPDSHYLCTVAAGGHGSVVKPQRMGVRHGNPIIVNRQLCIANAFEELIAQRTPRLHKLIRKLYDTCGYPVSKHIKTAFAADCTYVIMKPLEWIFLFVLYLCTTNPETRIIKQYLPADCNYTEGS